MVPAGLTTRTAGASAVGSDSGGVITDGVMVEKISVLPAVVFVASDPALDTPSVSFLPSTVTSVRLRPLALSAVRFARPPPAFEKPTCCREAESPKFAYPEFPIEPDRCPASARVAAWTIA